MIGILLDVGTGLKSRKMYGTFWMEKDVQMSLPAESYGLFWKKSDISV